MIPKSVEVFNDFSRIILLHGARKAAKTMNAATNKMMRHVWENDGAVLGVVGKTIRNVAEGAWKDLVSFCLPGWLEASIGMTLTVQPKMTSDSHMRYLRIKNHWGGESEIQLHSLDHDADVEKKFKSMRFSMVFISEIDQFADRKVLDILLDQLRVPGVAYENHQLLADCNPPIQGEDHWVYKALVDQSPENTYRAPGSKSYHFGVDDNWFLAAEERDDLKKKYEYDPIKYRRFVEGLWVKDTSEGFFEGLFIPNIHIVGNTRNANRDSWEILAPCEGTTLLITGSDLGDINHATTFLAARTDDVGQICFDIFDEIFTVNNPVSLHKYAKMLWDKIQHWNNWMIETTGKAPRWRHWSDSSAMRYRAAANATDAQIIHTVSEGQIAMLPISKSTDSIMARVNLARRLFHENRLFISASCFNTIEWATFLRPGASARQKIAKDLDCRHAFDSATYALQSELPIEVERAARPYRVRAGAVITV